MATERKVLNFRETFALADFIRSKYVEAKLTDKSFADLAAKELGFVVRETHINYARRQLGIEATKFVLDPKKSLLERIENLETQVARLQREIAHCKGYDQRGVGL